MIHSSKISLSILILAAAIIFLPAIAQASATNGTIDSANKYAWGEKIGWINFGTAGGNVSVTDTKVTGDAWSANYGWINLAPPGNGVINDGAGNLSGSAWGENIGWINFSGVKIGANGEFTGYATTTDFGAINFNCNDPGISNTCAASDFKVKTDWRPDSVRNPPAPPASGGGSSLPSGSANPPAPAGNAADFIVLINGGAPQTASSIVTLEFNDGSSKNMAISNSVDFSGAAQEAYDSPIQWNLCSKSGSLNDPTDCVYGVYNIYAKFYSKYGVPSPAASSSIIFIASTSTPIKAINQPISSSSVASLIGADSAIVNRITAAEAENIFSASALSPLTALENKNYLKIISADENISQNEKFAISYFIHFGTPTTLKIGSGERAGSIDSFQSAFGRLPASLADWQDVIKIANGRWPAQRSAAAEARAKSNFKLVYLRNPDMNNIYDNAAVTVMAYGLRPAARNLNSEKAAIKSFRFIFQRVPATAREWDVVRAIAYSGAKR
jgi:hypothetical protein